MSQEYGEISHRDSSPFTKMIKPPVTAPESLANLSRNSLGMEISISTTLLSISISDHRQLEVPRCVPSKRTGFRKLHYNTMHQPELSTIMHRRRLWLSRFCVKHISPFYFLDLLLVLFSFKLETVDIPFRKQADDQCIVEGCGARVKRNNVLARGKCRKLAARRWYWKEIFCSSGVQ